MKIVTAILCLCVLTFVSCGTENVIPQSKGAYSQLADAHKSFAIDLLKKLEDAQPDDNIFFSPASISMALSMTSNGAVGDTYNEISEALRTDKMTLDEINEAYQSMHYDLESLDPRVKLNIANSTWANEGFDVKNAFSDDVETYYDAEAYTRDFSKGKTVDEINDWAAKKTENKIKKVLDQIDPAARMFLLNAIYFKGDWKNEFDKKLTQEADFYMSSNQTVKCDMMTTESDFAYYAGDQIQMVDLPYGNESFSMSIILPGEGYDLSQLIQDLDTDKWDKWVRKLDKRELIVKMPSLELRYERVLNEDLQKLGMEKPFVGGLADFGNLTDEKVNISFVKHDSFLKIDEKGTEAAAVTTVGIELTSAGGGNQTPIMRVDRPYLLVIREQSTDNLLFVGKILNPNQ